MTGSLLVPLLVTAAVSIAGWYAAHRLAAARDRMNKRRDMRVQYLIEAYRRLEFVSNRPISAALAPEFEKAIADIQLFGTPAQVLLARDYATMFADRGTHSLDPLLIDLRNSLRQELGLEVAPANITYLRMTFDQERQPEFDPSRRP